MPLDAHKMLVKLTPNCIFKLQPFLFRPHLQRRGDGSRRQVRPGSRCRPPGGRQRFAAQVQEEDLSGIHDAGSFKVGLNFFSC
jgi:hypothetical protein